MAAKQAAKKKTLPKKIPKAAVKRPQPPVSDSRSNRAAPALAVVFTVLSVIFAVVAFCNYK